MITTRSQSKSKTGYSTGISLLQSLLISPEAIKTLDDAGDMHPWLLTVSDAELEAEFEYYIYLRRYRLHARCFCFSSMVLI